MAGYLGRGGFARTIVIGTSLWLGACAQLGGLDKSKPEAALTQEVDTKVSQSDLEKAIEHWGKETEKNPSDLKAALSYARNLKAAGQRERALGAMQQAALYHAQNRELQGEYGRLALDLDQLSLAQSLLESADDPARPDWRIVNARGAAHAKQGAYAQAIPHFERANTLAPGKPAVLNNLAMAYVADGRPEQAEPLLRQAVAAGGDAKVRQNLALVVGLQGKYDEAKQIASKDSASTVASSDVEYLRKMVRLQPQAAPAPAVIQAAADGDAAAPAQRTKSAAKSAPLRGGVVTDNAAPASTGWSTKVTSRSDNELGLKATNR